jgi:serine/threonine protein phosphatase PrpC
MLLCIVTLHVVVFAAYHQNLHRTNMSRHVMSCHVLSYLILLIPSILSANTSYCNTSQVFNADLLIPIPEIKTLRLTPEHEFLIIGSDGLWDVISSAEAVLIAR